MIKRLKSVVGKAEAALKNTVRNLISKIIPGKAVDDCDRQPAGEGRFLDAEYGNAAGLRAYKLYIPGGYRGRPVPLVVMLHGCSQSPDELAAGTRMNVLAEEQTFITVYPAQSAHANFQRCWNWYKPADQRRDGGEPSLIAGLTRQVMADYAIDPRRVYIAGLSAGAAAAVIMGAVYKDLYAAIGVHSGVPYGAANGFLSAFAAMRRGQPVTTPPSPDGAETAGGWAITPTIVFHGDQDTTVNPANGERVILQSRSAAPTALVVKHETGQVPLGRAYSRTLYLDAAGRIVLEHWVIHGSGHAWSGGCASKSYMDALGPDAAREMLRFFFSHQLSAARLG